MDAFIIVLIVAGAFGLVFAKPIWASFTTPASDLTAIRAEYEGLTSKAGPYTVVTDIRRAGTRWGTRSSPTFRKYEVSFKRQNGTSFREVLGVEASIAGPGEITKLSTLDSGSFSNSSALSISSSSTFAQPTKSTRNPAGIAAGFVVVLVLLLISALVSAPAAYALRKDLRQAHPSQRIDIVTLKTTTLENSCGYYKVGHDPKRWRYIDQRAGLWAEDLSKVWRYPSQYPDDSATLNERWQSCMAHTTRGALFDFLTLPVFVLILNAT